MISSQALVANMPEAAAQAAVFMVMGSERFFLFFLLANFIQNVQHLILQLPAENDPKSAIAVTQQPI